MNKRTQMADIARLANVSIATVSRALNGSSSVHPHTRQRITELAKSLNYVVHADAQNLRRGHTNTVGVVIPLDAKAKQHISDPFFLSLLGSIADALTERGFDMLVSRVDAHHLDAVAQLYDSGRVLGVIVVGQWEHHDQLNQMAARHLPMAVWGAQLSQQLYNNVGSDNHLGGYLATRHLLEQGRKRLLFLGDIHFPEVAQRYAGFTQAVESYANKPEAAQYVEVGFAADSAEQRMADFFDKELPRNQEKWDGIFAASDVLAMTAMRLIQARGLRVPQDIAVVGYDDIASAALIHPALTSVRQPISQAGEALVDTVLSVAAGENPGNKSLPTELVVRHSSQAKTE